MASRLSSSIAILCFWSLGAIAQTSDTDTNREAKLARWREFNGSSTIALATVQEELVWKQVLARTIPILPPEHLRQHWKPGVPEYDEALEILARKFRPMLAEHLSLLNAALYASLEPDSGLLSDDEVTDLYDLTKAISKERWKTMAMCSAGTMFALSFSARDSASRDAVDGALKALIPEPKQCNPTSDEAKVLDAFLATSGSRKLSQLQQVVLSDAALLKPLLGEAGKVLQERVRKEIASEIWPVLSRFITRIGGSS